MCGNPISMEYEATFTDEPTVAEKLAALDALAQPAHRGFSSLDLALWIVGAAAGLGWLAAYAWWL